MTQPGWYEPPPWGGAEAAWIDWTRQLPLFEALGLRCAAITDSHGAFLMAESKLPTNPNGSVNGGLVAAAVDQVMGAMAMRHAKSGSVVNTASLDVRYQRPAHAPLSFEASISKAGRTLVFVEVVIRDSAGRLSNTAAGTMMVVALRDTT